MKVRARERISLLCGLLALLTMQAPQAQEEAPACSEAIDCPQSAPVPEQSAPTRSPSAAALHAPLIVGPLPGTQVKSEQQVLSVRGEAEATQVVYQFELDTVGSFDSADRRASGGLSADSGGIARWAIGGLIENQHYFWRARLVSAHSESSWVEGDFMMNAVNDAPPVPFQKVPPNAGWVQQLQPMLQAGPVVDPEGDAVAYEFEIYRDAALMHRVAAGSSESAEWQPQSPLEDRSTYWWRIRAVDAIGAASAWSPAAVMYLSSLPYRQPEIQLLEPAMSVSPLPIAAAGNRKLVAIRWEGTDQNIEANVALSFERLPGHNMSTQIIDGLRQPAGTHTGSYLWDVTDLPAGTYSISAVIYDARGSASSRAPGSVVLVPTRQSGKLVVSAGGELRTSEDGESANFRVSLASKPSAEVSVPLASSMTREVDVAPQTLVFTPANWNQPQTVTVTGKPDCIKDGTTRLEVMIGPVTSQDPQYMGISGNAVKVRNAGSSSSIRYAANNPQFAFCSLRIISEQKTGLASWQYEIDAVLGNRGQAVPSISATLVGVPFFGKMLGGALEFGPVAQGEAIRSRNTIRIETSLPLTETLLMTGIGFEWNVTVP